MRRRDRQTYLDDEQADIVRDCVGAKKFARLTDRGKIRVWNRLLREAGLLPDPGPRVFPAMPPYVPKD